LQLHLVGKKNRIAQVLMGGSSATDPSWLCCSGW